MYLLRQCKTAMTRWLFLHKSILLHIMVAIRLNLHILYLSTHYSASVGSRTEEDFCSPFIIRVFTSLFRYLVLSQSSNHTSPLRHRQPHWVYGDVLFRQKAVGFPHYDRPRTYRNYYHGLMKRLDIPRLTRTAPQLCNTLHWKQLWLQDSKCIARSCQH